ncbi:MerR family transcriptional regulator [Vibrio sp. S4M6]|uniref:MerR family transcriptional regulator n=1 Tax=Vibrio sinus TaxID=2946865 RepID=UPI00202AAAE7|nr:MerR family transcriptional regulator [Vibrio sinus]MCL9782434.1 MerR family transcriptional regulator [Vibrio sinus]
MLTISQLAKKFGLSRTTILYYEREGLLTPNHRSSNGYRWYGNYEVRVLETIVSYRSYGMTVSDITALLNGDNQLSQVQLLTQHFNKLESEINKLRHQQKAIVAMLQGTDKLESSMVTKQRWVEIMQAAGFTQADMIKWHQKFEEMEPLEHQAFLESLGIDKEEIEKIRAM